MQSFFILLPFLFVLVTACINLFESINLNIFETSISHNVCRNFCHLTCNHINQVNFFRVMLKDVKNIIMPLNRKKNKKMTTNVNAQSQKQLTLNRSTVCQCDIQVLAIRSLMKICLSSDLLRKSTIYGLTDLRGRFNINVGLGKIANPIFK